jgi:hypothetical protein
MRNSLEEYIRKLVIEIQKEEGDYCPDEEDEELEEATTTDMIDGYNTPFAFGKGTAHNKEKRRKYSTNSTGYKIVKELQKEGLDKKDISSIKKLIRDVVANILRDIWIKRAIWKKPKS